MKKLVLVAAALALLAAPAALAADDPTVAAVKTDLQKLLDDAKAKHDTLIADAQQLQTDVQSVTSTSDRASVKATVQADLQKLRSDRQAAITQLQADREQLKKDLQAVHAAKAGKGQLKPLLQQAAATLKQEHQETVAAVQAAKQAEQQALAALKKK
jgi:hypothetical protein